MNTTSHPVVLFDGVCNLCNASVQWILQRDPKGIFHFAALQSDTGQRLLRDMGMPTVDFDTVVVVTPEGVLTHSDAPLYIAKRLGGLWGVLSGLSILPKGFRDGVYRWVARNRYRWFGKREECMLPQPGWRERFV